MNPDFRKLLLARFLVTMGLQIQAVLLGWQMYVLTKSALYVGLIGLAEAIPALGLALHAGLIVDRSPPLRIFRGVLVVSLISGLVLMVSVFPIWTLPLSGQITALFISSFVTGTARAFSQPSMYAIVPRLIPPQMLHTSSAWLSSSLQVARVAGPAVGGVLFGLVGVLWTSVVTVLFLIAALLVSSLIHIHIPGRGTPQHEPVRDALLMGLRYVLKHRILFPAMMLDMVSVFFGGVTALLPFYAGEILHVGALGLGVLRAAPALGATLMSLGMTRMDLRRHAGTWFFSCVTGFGLSILVFSISQNYALSFAALALSGAFDSVSMIVRTSAVQLSSPDRMRGRISSVNSIFISSSNELGEFESGVAAHLLGVVSAAIFGGLVCLVTVPIIAWLYPELRKLDLTQIQTPE